MSFVEIKVGMRRWSSYLHLAADRVSDARTPVRRHSVEIA